MRADQTAAFRSLTSQCAHRSVMRSPTSVRPASKHSVTHHRSFLPPPKRDPSDGRPNAGAPCKRHAQEAVLPAAQLRREYQRVRPMWPRGECIAHSPRNSAASTTMFTRPPDRVDADHPKILSCRIPPKGGAPVLASASEISNRATLIGCFLPSSERVDPAQARVRSFPSATAAARAG